MGWQYDVKLKDVKVGDVFYDGSVNQKISRITESLFYDGFYVWYVDAKTGIEQSLYFEKNHVFDLIYKFAYKKESETEVSKKKDFVAVKKTALELNLLDLILVNDDTYLVFALDARAPVVEITVEPHPKGFRDKITMCVPSLTDFDVIVEGS